MTTEIADLSDSNYRLEGVADHIDRTSPDLPKRGVAYLRLYPSKEDKDRCTVRGTGATVQMSDHSEILFSIMRLENGELQARLFPHSSDVTWTMTGEDLNEVVCRLITLHQMSGAGLDTHELYEYLTSRKGG